MKVKVSSDIKRFQEDKELASWFPKLLPIISSMDNCQAIEPGRKAPKTNGEEVDHEKSHDDDVYKEEASQGSTSRSSDGASNGRNKYAPTPGSREKTRGQTMGRQSAF